MSKISEYVARLLNYRNLKFTESEAKALLDYLGAFPEWAAVAGLDHYITGSDFFTLNNLLVTIRDIMEQDPNFSPAKQWALVRKQLSGDDFCSLKVLFDNVRTNLAIEAMGGQGYLLDTYSEDREPFLRKEFTENYHKAVIRPGLNWRDWIVYERQWYLGFRKGTVNLIGCSVNKEISENVADRLLVNAVNTRQELLTGQNVLAIAMGE